MGGSLSIAMAVTIVRQWSTVKTIQNFAVNSQLLQEIQSKVRLQCRTDLHPRDLSGVSKLGSGIQMYRDYNFSIGC